MPFEKGDDRINREGRPKNSKNRVNDEIRTRIDTFLEENFDTLQSDIKGLEPRDRVRFYIELLSYCVPKLRQTELKTEFDFDNLSDEEITALFNRVNTI